MIHSAHHLANVIRNLDESENAINNTGQHYEDPLGSKIIKWCMKGKLSSLGRIAQYLQKEYRLNLLNYEDHEGMRPIFAAIQEGHIEVLKYLLEFDIVDINCLNKNNESALHFAIRYDQDSISKYLIQDCGVHLISPVSSTNALHLAAKFKAYKVIIYLLNCNCIDIHEEEETGYNPLMLATKAGDIRCQMLLLSHTKSWNLEVITKVVDCSIMSDNVAIVKNILRYFKQNAMWNKQINHIVLSTVVKRRNLVILKMLVMAEKIDCSTSDELGNTAIMLAAMIGDIDIIKYMLSLNVVSVNAANKRGETALMLAVWEGHLEIAIHLVESAGANPKMTDMSGRSVYERKRFSRLIDFKIRDHIKCLDYILNKKKLHWNFLNQNLDACISQ